MNFFSGTIHSLEQAVNRTALQQKMISHNIANTDTPGYKAKGISFKEALDSEQTKFEAIRTDARHLSFGRGQEAYNVIQKTGSAYQANGNNVDIDKEMSELAENQIYYNAAIERLGSKFNSLKTVIKGGNG
jgi:flagellar basal-body rod protein FlgB